MKLINIARKFILGEETDSVSKVIRDEKVIQTYLESDGSTVLVSFPRTGSHWLRMMMELSFGRPSLVRIFYKFDRKDYLTLHTHDLDLDVEHDRIIYLYRNPVDTIYSQLSYHKEDHSDNSAITKWTELYAKHLEKWLVEKSADSKVSIHTVTYERLRSDMVTEMQHIADFLDVSHSPDETEKARVMLSKDEVKKKTIHDQQVVNRSDDYGDRREIFRQNAAPLIWKIVQNQNQELLNFFPGESWKEYLK